MKIETVMKKPITVKAMQWNPENQEDLTTWLDESGCHFKVFDDGTLGLGTLESADGLDRHRGKPGDWVIQGVVGEFYVCDREVFEMTYDIL